VFNGEIYAEGGTGTDFVEQKVNLKLDIRKHIGLQFTAKEKLLDITEFKERILRPQMRTLASWIEAEFLKRAYASVNNIVGTPGTIPTTMRTYALARAKMEATLTPTDKRTMLFSSDANVELVDASRALFHAKSEVERGFLRGRIAEAQNAMFYEHQSMPVHTNGTQATWTINGAGQTGSTLSVGGLTAANTIKAGTAFTIAGVKAVHPLTGEPYNALQQFVVTADFTATAATGTISIYPALNAVAPNRTVDVLPAAAAACTMVGAASTAYRQNLMFEKNAFTAAFAPLSVLAGQEGYTATLPNGFSVRVASFSDGKADQEITRIDVLAAFAAVRGNHACRVTE
jgi:hypothetical protein